MTMRAALIVYQDTEKGIGPPSRAKGSGVRLGAREKQKAVGSRRGQSKIQNLKSKIALAPSPVSFTGYHASGPDPGTGR
jgi:hypothetical protein